MCDYYYNDGSYVRILTMMLEKGKASNENKQYTEVKTTETAIVAGECDPRRDRERARPITPPTSCSFIEPIIQMTRV